MEQKKHNERGAGRKKKFAEETVQIGFRVPVSLVKECKVLMNNFLDSYLQRLKSETKPENKASKLRSDKNKSTLDCGCYMDGILYRRGKDCKKEREAHVFKC